MLLSTAAAEDGSGRENTGIQLCVRERVCSLFAGNCEGPVLRPAYSLEGPEGDLSKGYA